MQSPTLAQKFDGLAIDLFLAGIGNTIDHQNQRLTGLETVRLDSSRQHGFRIDLKNFGIMH